MNKIEVLPIRNPMAETFSKEERAAMRELAKERKLQQTRAESLAATLDRIETMAPADREIALAVHKLALEVNPDFQDGEKFKTRYSTIGFQQAAKLDEGELWPTSYAVTTVNTAVAKEITALIKRALG
jgi:uncharacterized protein YdhG (YjbR/CyaY superfamily)